MKPDRSAPPALAQVLERSAPLARLLRHGERLARWGRCVDGVVPPSLRGRIRLADVRGDVAVLHVDSPAWHARARFQVPQLLAALKAVPGLEGLRGVEVKVARARGETGPGEPAATRPRVLTGEAREWLARCAEAETDPALRAALQRLARR